MGRWPNYISVLGAVFIVFALGRAVFGVAAGDAQPGAVIDFVLLSLPGVVLWYVARWLPESDSDPELYSRVLAWCVGGVFVMLGFTALRVAHPGVNVDFTPGTQAIGVAIGSVGGLAIGIREAEATTRARELADQNEELATQKQKLARQNERLDEFTSIVSHDLRNPLNVAEGRVELARQEVDSDHLAEAADAHDRMEALIDDLLTLAHQGDTVDEVEPVDIPDLVGDCWEGVGTPEATLHVASDCVVCADELRLRQLFENLLRNAVEHGSPNTGRATDGGESDSTDDRPAAGPGGTVVQGAASGAATAEESAADSGRGVTVTVGPLEDAAGFYVEDDGPGIPPAERERVLDQGYSTSEEGTGFGLAIVNRVRQAHGWELSVEESDAGGVRFEFSDVTFADADA